MARKKKRSSSGDKVEYSCFPARVLDCTIELARFCRPVCRVVIRAVRSPAAGGARGVVVGVDGDDDVDVGAELEVAEEDGRFVAQAFAPFRVEMRFVSDVPLEMVTARDQMMVVGLEDAPYRLVTAVSRFVCPSGYDDGTVRVCVILVRILD